MEKKYKTLIILFAVITVVSVAGFYKSYWSQKAQLSYSWGAIAVIVAELLSVTIRIKNCNNYLYGTLT
ncbi:hypothetical protein [Algoriphagus sp. Y33]|uniref:hypothetical protein n=1 Tax=Algoriphagus sp. Y33 TaxID=2772483 RepID=UPI0017813EB2|nr:hypothetical protein [Algoriphagus sp. Y33]